VNVRTPDQLAATLRRIDGRGYKAYRDIEGRYAFPTYALAIDHVQGDPFAAPSRIRLIVPAEAAGLPEELVATATHRRAVADFLTRAAARVCESVSRRAGSGGSGAVTIDRPGQEVLERTSVLIDGGAVEARIQIGLPAEGRRVRGAAAETILGSDLGRIVRESLTFAGLDGDAVRRHVESVQDQVHLRNALATEGLVAFVGDGAILPRRSGVDPRPMGEGAIAFESPPSLRREFVLPSAGRVSGMGIPSGVTLIVGGGYHGKSTLLSAIELGVYDHIPGDGRERVVTMEDAVKIRAEDGRSVRGVDLSPFISDLPLGRGTAEFSSDDASGSTSQAANIIEALEYGTSLLLIDEDTSATNFMIRDQRMQELVAKEREPITPFIDKVRQMSTELGVSTMIVVGGVGDYFDVADTVVLMDSYRPVNATERAREIARRHAAERTPEGGAAFGRRSARAPRPGSVDPSRGRRAEKVDAKGPGTILFGRTLLDLTALEQLVSTSQTRAVGDALALITRRFMDGKRTLAEILDLLEAELDERGLDALSRSPLGTYARPRRQEIAAALNRLRTLRMTQVG
jgi:predicted ABC-class ATPase